MTRSSRVLVDAYGDGLLVRWRSARFRRHQVRDGVDVPKPAAGDLTVVALGESDSEAALALGIKPVGLYDLPGFGEANKGVGPRATDMFGDVTPTLMPLPYGPLDYEQNEATAS